MDRLRARISRRLHPFRHKEPASNNQYTSSNYRRSDLAEPAQELSKTSTPSVSSEVPITNKNEYEEAVPWSNPEESRSLSPSDARGEVCSAKGEGNTPGSSFFESSKEPDGDEKIPRNLWNEAFESLSLTTQGQLRQLGYEPSSNIEQEGDLDILREALQEKMALCDGKALKYQEQFVRDYAAKCATWIELIGDLVIPFAPSQAAGPWGLIKVALKMPVKYADGMAALLGTVERVLHATFRGREYESAYAIGKSDIVDTLRRDLVHVYQAVLELLSYSIDMLSKSAWVRILDTMFDKGSGLFSDLTAKEEELAKTAQACSAATGGKTIQHLQDIRGHLPRIETQVAECLEKLEWREALEILDWISPVKYGSHHNNVRGNRTPDTGDWLLQKGAFRDWEESSSSAVLWLRGSPGVGKTFLTSRVIDHVQDTLARTPNDEGFAYFYCNRTEDIRTRPLAVAQSYVRQLSSSASKSSLLYIQSRLRASYQEMRMRGADLDFERCKGLLLESLNLYPRTTLVLDAFDECDPASRGNLIRLFEDLLSSSTRPVKVFIASRPDRDVQQQVRSHPNIEVQATDNHQDIQAYISQEMLRLFEKNSAFRKLQDEIESTLSDKCQGMFQWTYLQIKQLEKCISPEAIRDCLGALPKTLDETYDRLYEEIENHPPHDRDLALRALKWVLAAREPLGREALLEAVRINPDITTTELCAPVSDDALLALCRNFLVIDSERDVWRVSHLSVAEYFELRRSWTTIITNLMVGKACLLFMLSDTCWNKTIYSTDAQGLFSRPKERYFTRPFLYYISCYWPEHIAILDPAEVSEDDSSRVTELLERFLGAPQDSSAQYQVWARFNANFQPVKNSILAVCMYGLQVSEAWWHEGELDLASTNEFGQTYMTLAAGNGHIPIMRILLAKGGTLGIQGDSYESTPLIEAAMNEHIEVARYLLEDRKADVNLLVCSERSFMSCALEAAVWIRNYDLVQFLVCQGHADVNIQSRHSEHGSPLALASSENWLEGVKLLVEQGGADVDLVLHYGDYGSALVAAAAVRHEGCSETLQYLVEIQRADVNLPLTAGIYGSALAAAVDASDTERVQYLVEVGKADVNMPLPNFDYGSALSRALYIWRMVFYGFYISDGCDYDPLGELVRVLLAAGARVVLNVGNGEIVDALEAFHGRRRPRPRCESTSDEEDYHGSSSDDDGDADVLPDEEDEDNERVTIARAIGTAMLADLERALWQQYTSGALSPEEAKYVEAKYGQEMGQRLSN
ncbi:hypothetical protein ASPBRDRAFT_40571 [Aspergillus brasiliensis CBS 101740]|uniref:Nephrocystin 3-like N-terminal domain-containing protein n=1 Tax=Aspergillus brasiliensis (strain CBS 101740 / IMI 381727 / IBT 21946) TaxID=767769 RepID=A0A1L9UU95_ASPBC|nr:hypothetical protein ASPBRDRAFT_40571 [Aspergillus brasiliensis CBS 101740]